MKSEEQYKKIEAKIIEAANGSEYAYTDAAWQKMELLLEKKKKRRMIFFWIWPLLLSAFLIGAYLFFIPKQISTLTTGIIINKKEKKKNISTAKSEPLQNTLTNTTSSKEEKLNNIKVVTEDAETGSEISKKTILPAVKKSFYKSLINTANNNFHVKDNIFAKAEKKYKTTSKTKAVIVNREIVSEDDQAKNVENINSPDTAFITTLIKPAAKKSYVKTILKADDKIVTTIKDTAEKTITKNKDAKLKKRGNKKVLSSLYVVTVAGAESNSTRLFSFANNSVTTLWGVDIGYRINNKWSIQTGFHSSAKKYIAGPSDYNAKAGTYLSMVNIIKVDANCRVYEIPLSIQYNWKQKKLWTFFTGVGLSSYIMKREDYNFTFERNNYVLIYPYSYTGNKNFIATIHLSAGIEKKFNRHIYLQASPVIHIPLAGVGQGSVKLYSKSIQVGLKYFPFIK
jgi:hypothetical protein